ncbi:hypothetical protein TcasGA2_TC033216 [Tribolium castaneum]|uniref:Uncharacterized protein n=1 Tax=Tribolium castaneum TaxID=7070 RepID=A0A139WHL3_TRICA|nr:hypothetical protein TcasGA2_TC033216 [Tribolium castaneum]
MQSFSNLLQQNLHSHNKYFGQHHHHIHFHQPNVAAFNISTDSCPETPSKNSLDSSSTNSSVSGSSPKVEFSSSPKNSLFHKNHNHHHHSIQELIRHFGKKVHNWRSDTGYRRNSCTEDSNKFEEDFRSRSKSLDAATGKRVLSDCEATYRIYESILREGRFNFA